MSAEVKLPPGWLRRDVDKAAARVQHFASQSKGRVVTESTKNRDGGAELKKKD